MINSVVKTKNEAIMSNIDVDINMDILKKEGIAEKDIDKLFDDKKLSTAEKDKILVDTFLSNPSHDNFNKLWERYYYGVKGHAYKFMHDWDIADDIALQTFSRAWEFKDKYDAKKAKFSTWLYIICRNLCLGEINNKKKQNIVGTDISEMYDSALLKNCNNNMTNQYIVEKNELVANTPDEITFKLYDTSLNEIDKLGTLYSKIMKMKFIENLKIREIADILDMNESTVKNYLYKGRELIGNIIKSKHKNLYEMYLETNMSK